MSSYFAQLMAVSGIQVGPTSAVDPSSEAAPAIVETSQEIDAPPAPIDGLVRGTTAASSTIEVSAASAERAGPTQLGRPGAVPSKDEVFNAIVRWVAAGPMLAGEVHLAKDRVTQTEPEVDKAPAGDVSKHAMPERVVREREVVSLATPTPAAASAPMRATAAAPAVPESSPRVAAAPPSVTIGAIHLRVEAPPPPAPLPASVPPPVRAAPRTPDRTAQLASRNAGLLKLRRHYVLPHGL